MRRFTSRVLVAACATIAGAWSAQAQDVEIRAALEGRRLPAEYYTRVLLDPAAYELKDGWRRRLAAATAQNVALEGTLRVAVIPTLFAGGAPAPQVVSTAALQQRLFDGPATSTITGYFAEISRGKLTMRGNVSSWIPTNLTITQVVGSSMGLGGPVLGTWLRQSIAGADAQIDFRQYDNDGPDGVPNSGDDDGRVDGAAFLFHEVDAACGGPGIWPHRARISTWGGAAAATQDIGANGAAIVVEDYIMLGAMDCTGIKPLESNVFAHEMGHVLGFRDFYDASEGLLRQQRRWVVGCWELMSGGAWGCGTGPSVAAINPPHMGAYLKAELKWLTPTVVPSGAREQEFVLRPVRTSGDALRINLNATEYLLLEYRDRSGFDSGLPASGVLAYRVQTGRDFLACPTCPRTYSYSLLEADGNAGLTRPELQGGNRGEVGDAYTTGAITNATIPSSARNNGSVTTVSIHSIVIDAAQNVARVSLTTAENPEVSPPPAPFGRRNLPLTSVIRVTGGAEPYVFTVTGTLPAGLQWTPQRDRLVFTGSPSVAGDFPVVVTARDALQVTVQQTVTITVAAAPDVTAARIIQALGDGGTSLSADERLYLDEQGNRNGRFDIGDARAYMRRLPK